MKRRVIAIDCDDVLVETIPSTMRWYNAQYDTRLQPSDFYTENLEAWEVPDNDTAIKRVHRYLETEEYQNLPPMVEAASTLKRLSLKHELHMVTGRVDFLREATLRWLSVHFPDTFASAEFTNFIVTSDGAGKTRSKADVCRDIGADILIDDHLHHALAVASCGIDVLLFGEYPWNATDDILPSNVTRVRDWPAVLEYFGETD